MSGDARPPLSVWFTGFWRRFDPSDNFVIDLLSRRYEVSVDDDPDVVFHSWWGNEFRDFDCTRVLISFENIGWGFTHSDFAVTSDFNDHERHYRYPLYAGRLGSGFVQPEIDPAAELARKEGFACRVVSNPRGRVRHRFYELLSEYREVASGGRLDNNVGGPVPDKAEFVRRYKFNLAFENSSYPGYTTEKLVDAMRANSVPIYWGHPSANREFNPRRFLNAREFPSLEALVERVIEIDQDDDLFCEMLAEPWFLDGHVPECTDTELLLDFFQRAVEWDGTPVGQRLIGKVSGTRLERKLRTAPRYWYDWRTGAR